MSQTQSADSPIYAFPPPLVPFLPILQRDTAITTTVNTPPLFPIHRVYCVGKNYTDHVKEMSGDVQRSEPVFFTKPADGVVLAGSDSDSETPTPIRYPPNTSNLHYECELVIAMGKDSECKDRSGEENMQHSVVSVDEAADFVHGFAVGIDLTRRDLQQKAKDRRAPWDTAKQFDQCAPIGSITQMTLNDLQDMESSLHMELRVNGVLHQSTRPLQEMIWSIPEIISELSQSYTLRAGDLIMTGTPAGVGPIVKGDEIVGRLVQKMDDKTDEEVAKPVRIVLV